MKILLVHNKYKMPGGEDSVFHSEAEMLRSYGHAVEELLFFNSDIKTLKDKAMNALRMLYNSKSAKAISERIESFRPDVIHVHNITPIVSPAIFYVAGKYRIPIVHTLHNYRLICPSATLYHKSSIYENSLRSLFPFDAIMKGVYRNSMLETALLAITTGIHHLLGTWRNKVDFYITLTSFAKNKFINAKVGLPEEKVLIKPNSVPDYGLPTVARQDQFLFVGRLVEEKGLRMLLQSTWLNPYRLVIIGDGPLAEEVKEFAKKNPNVVYLGQQDKETVVRYMKSSAALLFPSLWYEGLPVTILEAFATGTPVIASNIGAMKELIQDGVNGLLFEPGKESDVVRRIEDVLLNRVDVKALSDGARASYLRYYTPERNYNMLLTIYNKAAAYKYATSSKWELVHGMKTAAAR